MSKKVTLGGDRVGSGNRMKQELHNYFRSNHNLSCSRISSMAPGVLYPMYVNIGLTGDTFDFDINAFMRTLPTEGPMFGAFKLQVDVYSADFRLYQAILHNNTTEIGMKMDEVLLPKMQLYTKPKWIFNEETNSYQWKEQISKTSLPYYLGIAGLGVPAGDVTAERNITRKFNAIPMLAYYDIFKNYYANKQEENAYVIANSPLTYKKVNGLVHAVEMHNPNVTSAIQSILPDNAFSGFTVDPTMYSEIVIIGKDLWADDKTTGEFTTIKIARASSTTPSSSWANTNKGSVTLAGVRYQTLTYTYQGADKTTDVFRLINTPGYGYVENNDERQIQLQPFPLSNIDKMRKELLTKWDLGEEYLIQDNDDSFYPYKAVVEHNKTEDTEDELAVINPMQGLVVKCYQSDMFNNWLDTEWVNEITNRSRVNVTNGSFTMDALNMAKKLYNYYNRVATSGGTYDDWQVAAYGEENYGKSEKPIYHGGMSSEVVFDEVVSTSQTANEPLGSLGGRGTLKGNRGGHVVIKCREACVIMVMVSLTPRLTYSQGNAWYNTELDSMDDLHKPEFDRIGFQDLNAESMAWWGVGQTAELNAELVHQSIGKQTAWIHYQTDVDKCYGDFAEENGRGFMVLQRLFDYDQDTKGVKDITAYIDPSKYNYAFANSSLTAQNFWGFFDFDIKARRKMSAKQIPNF